MPRRFHIVDVFAREKYAGNQLAVVTDAADLDAATMGTIAAEFDYLARHEFFGSPCIDVRVEQGYEMGRPSLLHLAATAEGEDVEVEVGGSVVPVARGELV